MVGVGGWLVVGWWLVILFFSRHHFTTHLSARVVVADQTGHERQLRQNSEVFGKQMGNFFSE